LRASQSSAYPIESENRLLVGRAGSRIDDASTPTTPDAPDAFMEAAVIAATIAL